MLICLIFEYNYFKYSRKFYSILLNFGFVNFNSKEAN